METGQIVKALSGFYYVLSSGELFECRGRGRLRLEGESPLVGDFVDFAPEPGNCGTVIKIHPRKNSFSRPAVANIDCMVILASAVNPISDPFLLDRLIVGAEFAGCRVIICINKADMDSGDTLFDIYRTTGYTLLRTSAATGEGTAELKAAMAGRLCAFTGNSGVGKSSLINCLSPELSISVGDVSDKLGRGRHTTRHVEMFTLDNGAAIADTPGFSSFESDKSRHIPKEQLQNCFAEFKPYLNNCRFDDCTHRSEPGCAVLQAVEQGNISVSRHESYLRLYELSAAVKAWETK